MLQSGFGLGNGESKDVVSDLWDPESTGRGAAHDFVKKEWNLFLVNDKKIVNGVVAPGVLLIQTFFFFLEKAHNSIHDTCDQVMTAIGQWWLM